MVACFFIAWVLLFPGLAGHVTSGDAAELALAGATLGIAHPPGYPFFSLVHRLLSAFLPWSNPAYQQNVVSCWLICAALALTGASVRRATSSSFAIFLPLILVLSPLFRHAAAVTEVFPLTLFFFSLAVFILVHTADHPNQIVLMWYLLVVAWFVHQTLALAALGVMVYAGGFRRLARDTQASWRSILLLVGLACAVTLYLPIRSMTEPVLDWEDPQSLRRFWGVLTRSRYGFFQLTQGAAGLTLTVSAVSRACGQALRLVIENLGWTGLVTISLTLWFAVFHRYQRRYILMMVLVFIFSGPFFFWVSRVPVQSDVLVRFSLLPLLAATGIFSIGLAGVLRSDRAYRWATVAVLIAVVLEVAPRVRRSESMRNDSTVRETAMNLLREVPAQAILLSDRADETEFALAYFQGAEGTRPGLEFIDCNAGVTRSAYGDDYYFIWGPERLERREQVESDLVRRAAPKPVYYSTVDPNMVMVPRIRVGALWKAVLGDHRVVQPIHQLEFASVRYTAAEKRSKALVSTYFTLLGDYFYDQRDTLRAEKAFGLAERSGGLQRYEQLGFLSQRGGQEAKALAYYLEALKTGVTSDSLFSNLGVIEHQNGNVEAALGFYRRGLDYHPDSAALLYNSAVIYWEQENWAQVVQLLERLLANHPQHHEASRLLPVAKRRLLIKNTGSDV